MLKPLDDDIAVSEKVLIALRKIIQATDLHSRYLVRHTGLTGPQIAILQEINKRGEVSVGKIARAISLSHATVTGIIERLEKRNLVVRRKSEDDRRKVIVTNAEESQMLLKNAAPHMQSSFLRQFNHLQPWEQTMILSSLQRIASMMDEGQFRGTKNMEMHDSGREDADPGI
jgi:DNA-binding MarR family transcriptional regulator